MLEYKKIDATSEAAIHDLYRSDASYKTNVDQIIASPDFSRMSLEVQESLRRVANYDLSKVSTQASGSTAPVDISQLNAKAKDF